MNNIPQCKCCGDRVGYKKDLPTALLDKYFWNGVCVGCLDSFGVTKKNKKSILDIGKYLEAIVLGTLDRCDRKLDVYRAKYLYAIAKKDMYAAFEKGCSYCGQQEDNWTKLSLWFSEYGKPSAICKQCCLSKFGEDGWLMSLTGEQRTAQKKKSYAACQSKRRMNTRDKQRDNQRSYSPYTNVQGFISHARYNPEATSFPLKGSKVKRYYVDPKTLKD